jgi:hypothetical protein
MSLAATAAVVGIAGTAYGAYNANRQARFARDAQNQALANSSTQLGAFRAFGTDGQGVTFGWTPYDSANPNGPKFGDLTLHGGALDPISAALSQYAGQAVPSFSNQLPAGVQQALQQLQARQAGPGLDLQGLDTLTGGANNAFAQARDQLATAGQLPGFDPASIFGAANTQLGSLNQTYDQAYGNTLNTLREQARPEEERAFAGLQDNLFATGRLGSTGGALQTEAFARGLGQADLSRQLAAGQEARLAQQNALGLGQGLFGVGAGGMGLQDQLLNSAFGRFGQTTQLAADLNQARFARSMYGNELAYGRAQDMLGTQINLAGLPASLQAAQLGNVSTALQGQSGIQQQLLQMFGAGLSAEQAAANARIGAGSNMAQIVGSPSFGAAGQANAAMWSQLGSSLLNNSDRIGDLFGSIFGGNNIQSPDAWGALNNALASGQVTG